MSRSRAQTFPVLLLGAVCVGLGRFAFVGPAAPWRAQSASRITRRGLLDDFSSLQKNLQDPEKLKEIEAMAAEIMKDPAKKKMLEDQSAQMQSVVEGLKDDPEMKEFFEDMQKGGLDALQKYENNPEILRKFSQATAGVAGMPSMESMAGGAPPPGAMAGAPAAGAVVNPQPGAEVYIQGLSKAPELNGKKAMVVPPTAEERAKLEGTDRVIVRLLDTGDQFAVKPENLRTSAEEADAAMSGSLEDVSMYNPAIQTEAAKLRESGKLADLQNDPELKPIFEDIKKNGMGALEKYWEDEKLMAKISKAMGVAGAP